MAVPSAILSVTLNKLCSCCGKIASPLKDPTRVQHQWRSAARCRRWLSPSLAHGTLLAHTRRPRCPCGLGEVNPHAILEDHRLILIRHRRVHDWAALVALHVGLKPLMGPTPAHSTHLPARQHPLRVTIELLPEGMHPAWIDQVDECVAQASTGLEVDRQVDEVVLAVEALVVQHGEQHRTRVVVRQIPQHHRGSLVDGHLVARVLRLRCHLRGRRCRADGARCDGARLGGDRSWDLQARARPLRRLWQHLQLGLRLSPRLQLGLRPNGPDGEAQLDRHPLGHRRRRL
mmetsp:Transcript_57520/g.168944  ORF Transcript_57520/g.168944 Transcript_57520/m.168944 type:complete len:288 (-) Transcript_57520:91-954(-)